MIKIKLFIHKIKVIWKFIQSIRCGDELEKISKQIEHLDYRIGDNTTIHGDIHTKRPSIFIATGKFKGRDYVRIFNVDKEDFVSLVEELKSLEKNSKLGVFDDYYHGRFLRDYTKRGRLL